MANTTTTQITPNVSGFYDRRLLDRLVPSFYHVGFGVERPTPKNNGTTITWRRYTNLTAATTALTEGVTPAGSQLAKTDYTATLAQYGDYVTLTDWLDMTGLDKTAMEATDLLGDQAGDTLDQVCRDVLVAGTYVIYRGNSAARSAVDEPLHDASGDPPYALQYAQYLLETNNVKTLKEKIIPGTGYNSFAVNPSYIAIVHPSVRYGLEGITGFIKAKDYANPGKLLPGEIGSYGLIRFIATSNAKVIPAATAGGGVDVYLTLVFGEGAFGNSSVGPRAVKSIVKSFGSAGTEDPLDQRSTVGWKASFVTKILDDNRIVRIEHTSGAPTMAGTSPNFYSTTN